MRPSDAECRRRCGRTERLYVAVSNELHRPDRSQGRPWAGHYVFKVGVTKSCQFRQATINGPQEWSKPWHNGDVYAGVSDWQIVHCWPASMRDEDKNGFRPWAEKQGFAVAPVICDPSGRAREELYRLRPLQMTLVDWPATGHVLYDEIVNAATRELQRRVWVGELEDLGPVADDGLVVEFDGEADPARSSGGQSELVAEDWVNLVETAQGISSVELQTLQAVVARSIAAARAGVPSLPARAGSVGAGRQSTASDWSVARRLIAVASQAFAPE